MNKGIDKITFKEVCECIESKKGNEVFDLLGKLLPFVVLFFPEVSIGAALVKGGIEGIGDLVTLVDAMGIVNEVVEGVSGENSIFKKDKKYAFDKYGNLELEMSAAFYLSFFAAYFESVAEYIPEYNQIGINGTDQEYVLQEAGNYQNLRNGEIIWDEDESLMPRFQETSEQYKERLIKIYDKLNTHFFEYLKRFMIVGDADEVDKDRLRAGRARMAKTAYSTFCGMNIELQNRYPQYHIWRAHQQGMQINNQIVVGFEKELEILQEILKEIKQNDVLHIFEEENKIYQNMIEQPLLSRDEIELEEAHVVYDSEKEDKSRICFPVKKDIFIPQNFKTILYQTQMEKEIQDNGIWEDQKEKSNIGEYLLEQLQYDICNKQPIIILGHPGAGKSLLCQMLAARVLCQTYQVIVVRLRDVNAELGIAEQIAQQLSNDAKEPVYWGKISTAEDSRPFVIIFDGYDELLQASGINQYKYIDKICEFQKAQLSKNRQVKCIVTSRLNLLDKVKLRDDMLILKLEGFDDQQIVKWCEVWNEKNQKYFMSTGIKPFFVPKEAGDNIKELAEQPLLLLLLAIYDSDRNEVQNNLDITATQLYEDLIKRFVGREKRKDEAFLDRYDEDEQKKMQMSDLDLLGLTAIAMYNRNAISLQEEELNKTMRYMYPEKVEEKKSNEISQSEKIFSGFLFIHTAQKHDDKKWLTYEFMHNTFGEFLTVYFITQKLKEALFGQDENEKGKKFNWYRALIFQPLFERPVILEYFSEWAKKHLVKEFNDDSKDEEYVMETMRNFVYSELNALEQDSLYDEIKGALENSDIEKKSMLSHLAIYTVNLVLLGSALLNEKGLCISDSNFIWERLTGLWRSEFKEENLGSLANVLQTDKDEKGNYICFYVNGLFGTETDFSTDTKRLYQISTALHDESLQCVVAVADSTAVSAFGYDKLKEKMEKFDWHMRFVYLYHKLIRENISNPFEELEELGNLINEVVQLKQFILIMQLEVDLFRWRRIDITEYREQQKFVVIVKGQYRKASSLTDGFTSTVFSNRLLQLFKILFGSMRIMDDDCIEDILREINNEWRGMHEIGRISMHIDMVCALFEVKEQGNRYKGVIGELRQLVESYCKCMMQTIQRGYDSITQHMHAYRGIINLMKISGEEEYFDDLLMRMKCYIDGQSHKEKKAQYEEMFQKSFGKYIKNQKRNKKEIVLERTDQWKQKEKTTTQDESLIKEP